MRTPCYLVAFLLFTTAALAQPVNLSVHSEDYRLDVSKPSQSMQTALRVLVEEMEKRTGTDAPESCQDGSPPLPVVLTPNGELPEEGYRITIKETMLLVEGSKNRGLLYGVGHVLRHCTFGRGTVQYHGGNTGICAPAYPMRGHQLGYRFNANSYDTWDDRQYEQYIRELALFGANSIENIPFQDDRKSPHMPLDRRTMNRRISEICADYGLDYWIWTPAEFDLADKEKRKAHLAEHVQLYKDCPELTGVFFPGGDPGANPPELVLPFMEELSRHLHKKHPEAKMWLSLQWFNAEQCESIQSWIDRERPDWLGGLVAGPGSPPLPETRARLNRAYPLRHYPDITHNVRCQYPSPWWDPAFALTLGREAINPRPLFYAFIHNYYAPFTEGFITYSDGIHDDVNKTVWSQRGWDPEKGVREILAEYASFFFSPVKSDRIADAILALEKNWEGAAADNGGITATQSLWQQLEQELPGLANNWRWQTMLVRAYYDAYTRTRLQYETDVERQANAVLLQAQEIGSGAAMDHALQLLKKCDTENCAPELHARVVALYDQLFHSIGLKSSVPKYQSSGYERGCSLDFLDYPLNNRWWLEDEFAKVRLLEREDQRVARLQALALWANPGTGSFYDDIGHVGLSTHVKRTEGLNTDPSMERSGNPEAWWWDQGFSRQRLSWQSTLSMPFTMVYEGLDPAAEYMVRLTGCGESRPRANGFALTPSTYNTGLGEIKEFPIPRSLTSEGRLEIVWDPIEESHLNWRQQSRIAEVWLIRK